MSTIVIMPGGFHPFHAGHYALYQSAKQAFPDAEVYVAATNDTSERPFPFQLKEKLAKLAGVEPGHFVQVKSPFQAKEITQNYNPEEDVVIFVRSEKDRDENPKPGGTKKDGSPAYFQPWTGKDVQPFAKHAYFEYLPTVEFGPGITSATEIRKAWPTLNDKRKLALVMSLYPATQENLKLAKNVSAMFDQVMGEKSPDELEESAIKNISRLVSKITPMLGEATIQQKSQFVKLLENAKKLMTESANKKTIVAENADYIEEK
jgi:phosphopantetheine adenylyltransferase